jgi:Putative prokaryotic signal transducing protein
MPGRILPFRRHRREPDDDGSFEEVTRARDSAEAVVVQSLLESYGIRVLLRTNLAHSVHPFTVGDQGEVRILVPRERAAEARRLLLRLTPGSALP